MILDCGEGTWGQLYRYYGLDEVNKVLSRLRAIYVSHLHADHHIGLIGLLKAIAAASKSNRPLYLLAPAQISTWLTLYHKRFENILDNVRLVPNYYLVRFIIYRFVFNNHYTLIVYSLVCSNKFNSTLIL